MRLRFFHEPDQVKEDKIGTVILYLWRMDVFNQLYRGFPQLHKYGFRGMLAKQLERLLKFNRTIRGPGGTEWE